MIKQDIVRHVAQTLSMRRDDASIVVEATLSAMFEGLSRGEDVFIRGFGTFKIVTRNEKVARDICKNTFVTIPAHRTVKFIPGKELRKVVRNDCSSDGKP